MQASQCISKFETIDIKLKENESRYLLEQWKNKIETFTPEFYANNIDNYAILY